MDASGSTSNCQCAVCHNDGESSVLMMAHVPVYVDVIGLTEFIVNKRWAASISIMSGIYTKRYSKITPNTKHLTEEILLIQTKSSQVKTITNHIKSMLPENPSKVNITYLPIEVCSKKYKQWMLKNSSGVGDPSFE